MSSLPLTKPSSALRVARLDQIRCILALRCTAYLIYLVVGKSGVHHAGIVDGFQRKF
jgi:hypothetical protein